MDIQRIKYNAELIKNKIRLQKELKMIDEEIISQQKSCNHLNVSIGLLDCETGDYEHTYECLFCGIQDLDGEYIPTITASSYLQTNLRVHYSFKTRRNMILGSLRNLSLQYISSNPSCTMEELIMVLKREIDNDYEESMQKRKSKKNNKGESLC